MKKTILLLSVLMMFSCKKQEPKKVPLYPDSGPTARQPLAEIGQDVFEGKGNCAACHQADQKIIGPSIKEIAAIYRDKNGDIISFLKGEAKPLVDPSQYEVMKANFAITKTMSEAELKALEAYMYSK